MQEHLAKLRNDSEFYQRLSETLHSAAQLNILLSQVESLDHKKVLLKHMNSPEIRRFVLDSEFLQRGIDKLRRRLNVDEWPLGLVLTFLSTATIPKMNPTVR